MMDMMDMKNIGIDRIAWSTMWRLHNEIGNLPDTINILKPLLKEHMDPVYFDTLSYALNNGYDIVHWWDSLSENQLQSKLWLMQELESIVSYLQPIRAQVYGGWFGYPLIDILISKLKFEYIENIDIDEKAILLFKRISQLKGYNEKSDPRLIGTIDDVNNRSEREWNTDLIINTSSEHMPPLPKLMHGKKYRTSLCLSREILPDRRTPERGAKGPCLFALQSNNMFHIDDHINCVNNEDELVEKSGFIDVRYKGSMTMPNGYTRFMAIGYA
jgi:hypothetical protein